MAINPLDRGNPGYWYGQNGKGDLPEWVLLLREKQLKDRQKEQDNEQS